MTEDQAKTQIFEALADYIRAGGCTSNANILAGKFCTKGWQHYKHEHSISGNFTQTISRKKVWNIAIKIIQILAAYRRAGGWHIHRIVQQATGKEETKKSTVNHLAKETLYFIGEGGDCGKGATGKEKHDSNRHPRSIAAQREQNERKLRYEHAIPFQCWVSSMVKHGEKLSDEQIKALIKNNYHIRIVTIDEDEQLKKLRLSRKMPPDCGWGEKHFFSKPFSDIFVRYKRAGIKFREGDLVPYSVLDGFPLSKPSSH